MHAVDDPSHPQGPWPTLPSAWVKALWDPALAATTRRQLAAALCPTPTAVPEVAAPDVLALAVGMDLLATHLGAVGNDPGALARAALGCRRALAGMPAAGEVAGELGATADIPATVAAVCCAAGHLTAMGEAILDQRRLRAVQRA